MDPVTLQYADPAGMLRPFYLTAGAFVLVGLVGAFVCLYPARGRRAWADEPPHPIGAAVVFLLCVVLAPFGLARLWSPLEFHTLEVTQSELRFHRVLPEAVRVVPLDDLVRVEILKNRRLAFWFVDPEGPHTDDDLEVTSVLYTGHQAKHLAEVEAALESAGWSGEVAAGQR